MVKLELNTVELQHLVQLIDIAVKAGGLQVAGAAVVLHQKLTSAVEAARNAAETQASEG